MLGPVSGQPPNKLTTFELNVRILNVGPKRFRVEFDRYLQGPKEASAIQVILSAGWLLIDVEQYELPLEPSANLNGWAAAARAGWRCARDVNRCAPGPACPLLGALPTAWVLEDSV